MELKWLNSIYRLKNVTDTTVDRCDSIFNGLSSTQVENIILLKKWPFHTLNWIKLRNGTLNIKILLNMTTICSLQTLKHKIQNKRWCEHYARPVFITDRRTQLTLRHEVSPVVISPFLLVTTISSNCLIWYSSRASLTLWFLLPLCNRDRIIMYKFINSRWCYDTDIYSYSVSDWY